MSLNRTLESIARDIPSYANPDPRAVAVVGMSISAPAGLNHGIDTEEFYRFLQSRGSGIITVPSDRWNADAFHGTAPGKIGMRNGCFIPDLRYGDPQEFSITTVEALQMSTTQMLLLHQAFSALQRSGVDHRGTNTGVYIGSTSGEALFEMDITQAGAYYMTGKMCSIEANRINYVFDLLGPSMPVDTACSSSLVAMHLAIQAIRNGDCDQAVVAGVNVVRSVLDSASFSRLGVLSPDGVSRSFDEDGNGYARADVASAVVIKRHDLAVKDLNRIHATLVGTALTSCGSIMGSLTTPSPAAQEAAIRLAYRDAALQPHQVDFVELHGTGTVVGDSTEANAAVTLVTEGPGIAYMTSLVKVVMMLVNKQVVPNGYFKKPSSRIDFEKFNLRVPVAVENFAPADPTLGRIASISSYGAGGAGGHTVLREHEPRPTMPGNITLREPLYLFAVGGLSPKGCSNLVEKYKEDYADVDPLALCEHLGNRARQLTWRTFAVAESIQAATFPEPILVPKRPNPIVLCFSGQGPQHWQQGRELYYTFKAFRDSIDECDRVHVEYTGESFLQNTGLFKPDGPMDSPLATSRMWPSDIISIALVFFQIALFDLLVSLGLKPDAVVGHSVGETAVLYASGAVPRSMAVKLSIARGRALAMLDNTGGRMVIVSGCDADKVRNYAETAIVFTGLDKASPQLFLATFNSPNDTAVSGAETYVDAFVSFIKEWVGDVAAHKLRINTAGHSPFVDPRDLGNRRLFVEISPHPVLSQYIKSMGALDALPASRRPPSLHHLKPGSSTFVEVHTLLEVLGSLLLQGVNSINFSGLTSCPEMNFEGPAYPFNRREWRFGMDDPSYIRRLLPKERPLNSMRLRVGPVLPNLGWATMLLTTPYNLIPAAAYLEMGLEFPDVTYLYDCRFATMYVLEESGPPGTLEVSHEGNSWWVKSSSQMPNAQGDMEWTRIGPTFDVLHAHGNLGYGPVELGPDAITHVDVDALLARCTHSVEGDAATVACNDQEALAYVRGHVDGLNRTDYAFHPALLDAVFQSSVSWQLIGDKGNKLLVPQSVQRIFRNDGSGAPLVMPEVFLCYTVLHEWSPEFCVTSLHVLGEDHSVIFTVEGLRSEIVQQHEEWPSVHYKMLWQPRDLPQSNLEGLIVLPEQTAHSRAEEVLKALDELAVHYTRQTLDVIPRDFAPMSFDRKLYLEWAQSDEYEALFELTRRVGSAQKDIMVTSTAAVEQLFTDDLMSKVYEHPPFVGVVFDETVVRVLEVGAGTGRLTAWLGRALLEAKLPDGFYVDYVCSDISISLAQEPQRNAPGPIDQRLDRRSFDIVVAFDVLHATHDIHATLVTVKDLLCSGGHAVVLELDDNSFASAAIGTTWLDFIFGSFQEWFGVLESRPGSAHCTLSAPQWKDAAAVDPSGLHKPKQWTSLRLRDTCSAQSSQDSFAPIVIVTALTSSLRGQFKTAKWIISGGEVALVDFISSLDSTYPYILWLHTDMEASNAAVMGLARTLRLEYPAWTIYLAIFPGSWNVAQQDAYVRLHLQPLPCVDSELRGTDIWRAYPAEIGPNDVEVSVQYIGLSMAGTYMDRICWTGQQLWATGVADRSIVGRRVFGATNSPQGNVIVCNRAKIAVVPDDMGTAMAAALVGRLVFLSLAVVEVARASSKKAKVLLHAEDNCLDRTLEVFVPAVIAALSPSLDIYDLSQLAAAEAQSRLPSTSNHAVLIDLQTIDPHLSVLKGGVLGGTPAFNPRASYVIIGDIGELSLNIARCLVNNGAKHIILTSGSGESTFSTQKPQHEKLLLRSLRAVAGVTIDLRAVDVLDGEKTRELFSNIEHPVAGIFYVAVRLNDQVFANMKTEEDWKAVYDVKIKGIEILLETVNPQSLDFLVLTSSMASLFGSPGQANYAAAQTHMEGLVKDLPNTVIVTFPPITDGGTLVGSLPTGKGRNVALDKYKNLRMTGYRLAQHCVDAIWTLNSDAYSSVYIPPTDWKEIIHLGIPDYHLSLLRHLLVKENIENGSTGKELSIRATLASVLALDQNEIVDNVPLSSYGLDSLTSVRLSGILKKDFGMNITQLQLLGNAMTEQHVLAASSTNLESSNRDAQALGMEGTVVLVHGAGGGVLVMLKTAEMISSPVYGVQDTPEAPIDGTMEQLASFYLQKIRAKQPTGPYRLGGFSFGTCMAFVIAQMLQQTGETVELLILIDGSPAEKLMTTICDLSTSGSLDNGEELGTMFENHFERVSEGTPTSKFVSQFARAYVAHVRMGIRAAIEALRREEAGESDHATWPATRTVVIRATKGICDQPVAEGLSRAFDVDLYAPDVELYEREGTHFGILNPQSGLPQLLDGILSC
ncbi:hypothetical protein BU15DRAFT_76182 [Melanogaster broomeanus]|nr:hypothetical protein BU15DRAFT_76182 [Melanogaster broomeanus]